MQSIKFLYWQENGAFIGYLLDYPGYWTQGETMEDLEKHLRDLDRDLQTSHFTNDL